MQSLVQQTLRDGRPAEEARTTLTRRLEALARAQDALTSTERDAASLSRIVAAELVPYTGRVSIDGPLVIVEGAYAQTFSLLVHELATNAAKYGALSNAAGRVSVSWSIEGEREAARLRFRWQERDGPVISEPSRTGFGSRLLETALPVTNDSPPRLSFNPHGLVYEVDVALAAISAI